MSILRPGVESTLSVHPGDDMDSTLWRINFLNQSLILTWKRVKERHWLNLFSQRFLMGLLFEKPADTSSWDRFTAKSVLSYWPYSKSKRCAQRSLSKYDSTPYKIMLQQFWCERRRYSISLREFRLGVHLDSILIELARCEVNHAEKSCFIRNPVKHRKCFIWIIL